MKVTCLHDVPPQKYEDNLREVVTHARPFEYNLLLRTGSDDLAALALAVNPALRAELWDTLSEEMRAFVEYYDSWFTTEDATARMVDLVVHNVTQQWYSIEAEEIVAELIASVQGEMP